MTHDQQSSSAQKPSQPASAPGSGRVPAALAARSSRRAPLPDPFQFSVYLQRLAAGARRR